MINPDFSGSIVDYTTLYNHLKTNQKEREDRLQNALKQGADLGGKFKRRGEVNDLQAKFDSMSDDEKKQYGWMTDPEYAKANEAYIQTGDNSAINNLRSAWNARLQQEQAQQNADRQFKLQEDQIATQKAEADAAKIAAKAEKDRVARLSANQALNKITYASKITDSSTANQLIMNAKDTADDLSSQGYTDLADEIVSKIPGIQAAGVAGDNSAIDKQIAELKKNIQTLPPKPESNIRTGRSANAKAYAEWTKTCNTINKANAEIQKKIAELEAQRK